MGRSVTATPSVAATPHVTPAALFTQFLVIGAISFGGGIVAYLRRMLVDQTKWLTEEEFLTCLEVSQTLPGTNSVNMSVLVGDRFCGTIGAAAALTGLMLPGTILILILAIVSGVGRHNPIAHAALAGVTAGAVGILAAITLQTGKRQFTRFPDIVFLILTFAGMAIFKVRLLVLVIVLGGICIYLYRPRQADHG